MTIWDWAHEHWVAAPVLFLAGLAVTVFVVIIVDAAFTNFLNVWLRKGGE